MHFISNDKKCKGQKVHLLVKNSYHSRLGNAQSAWELQPKKSHVLLSVTTVAPAASPATGRTSAPPATRRMPKRGEKTFKVKYFRAGRRPILGIGRLAAKEFDIGECILRCRILGPIGSSRKSLAAAIR